MRGTPLLLGDSVTVPERISETRSPKMDVDNELKNIINDLSATKAGGRSRRVGRAENFSPFSLLPTAPLLDVPEEPHSPTESELELEDIAQKASARLEAVKRTAEDFNQDEHRRDGKSHRRARSPWRRFKSSRSGGTTTGDQEQRRSRHTRLNSLFSHYHVNKDSAKLSPRNEPEHADLQRDMTSKEDREPPTNRTPETESDGESFDREMNAIMSSLSVPEAGNGEPSAGMSRSSTDQKETKTRRRFFEWKSPSPNRSNTSQKKGILSPMRRRKKSDQTVKVKPKEHLDGEKLEQLDQDVLKKQLEDAVQLYYNSISVSPAVEKGGDMLEGEASPLLPREREVGAYSDSPRTDIETDCAEDSSHLKPQGVPCSITTPRSRTPISYQDFKELEERAERAEIMSVDNNNDTEDLSKISYHGRGPKLSSDSAIAMETEETDYTPSDVIKVDRVYAKDTASKKKNNFSTQIDSASKSSKNRALKMPSNHPRNNVKHADRNRGENFTASIFQKLDIVGDTSEHRYPWQRDVFVQCDSTDVLNQSTQTSQPSVEMCEKCRAMRSYVDGIQLSRSPSPKSILPGKLPMENGINFRNSTVKVQAVRPQVSEGLNSEEDSRPNSVKQPNSKIVDRGDQSAFTSRGNTSRTFSESSINNRFRDMYFRHIQPGQATKSAERHRASPLDNLSQENSDNEVSSRRSQRPRLRTAESVDLPITGTQAQLMDYRSSPSPPMSPAEWAKTQNSPMRQSPQVLVTHADDGDSLDSPFAVESLHSSQESLVSEASSLTVPLPDTLQTRAAYNKDSMVKCSSGSENQSDEEDDIRPPPSAFRRRRGAMTSETLRNTLQVQNALPEESEGSPGLESRRPSAHIVSLPSLNISPGDLHVVDGVPIPGLEPGTSQVLASYLQGRSETYDSYGSLIDCQEENKKSSRSTWTLRKTKKEKEKDREKTSSLEDLSQVLNNIKIKEIDDFDFAKYKGMHWSEFFGMDKTHHPIPETELKRREAVWELFKGECVYLLDHLMVLRNVFLEPIKDVQCEGHLMFVEPSKLFANLDELCQVTVTFCQLLERLLSNSEDFGRTEAIVTAFTTFGSRVSPAYQRYCLNYSGALAYLEHIKKQADFLDFLKWCEQDPRCNRLQVSDLLVAPMQHVTKYPLLLKNIRKKTKDSEEILSLTSTVHIVENCLREMEGKVKWITSFERLRELQYLISWPPVEDIDTKTFVPEFLKSRINRQSCTNILASPKRMLLHEGPVLLSVENTKSVETYLFLFDDMLLVTKMRKVAKKKTSMTDGLAMLTFTLQSIPHKKDGIHFTVYKQPIPLDRLELIDVEPQEANGLKNGFVVLHISRFQQVLAILTFQGSNSSVKNTWLTQIRTAKDRWAEEYRNRSETRDEKRTIKSRKKTL
ncbi:uncharacterized protein [Ptychodera flava]|uniref:uncharacterized protein isoform X3 n=2 Tax=Ptychodera flava TaxID=63121 RepID=UPI00396A29B3